MKKNIKAKKKQQMENLYSNFDSLFGAFMFSF